MMILSTNMLGFQQNPKGIPATNTAKNETTEERHKKLSPSCSSKRPEVSDGALVTSNKANRMWGPNPTRIVSNKAHIQLDACANSFSSRYVTTHLQKWNPKGVPKFVFPSGHGQFGFHPKIVGTWMFIPQILKSIGFDSSPHLKTYPISSNYIYYIKIYQVCPIIHWLSPCDRDGKLAPRITFQAPVFIGVAR